MIGQKRQDRDEDDEHDRPARGQEGAKGPVRSGQAVREHERRLVDRRRVGHRISLHGQRHDGTCLAPARRDATNRTATEGAVPSSNAMRITSPGQ